MRTNLVICAATGPLPHTGSAWLALDTPGPLPSRKREFILTQQRQKSKAIKPGILGLLALGSGPRGKLPITRRTRTQPRARLHVASSPSPLAAPGVGGHARACVCAHTCVPSAAASGSAHPSRVPLSPHKPRLTGGWPHLSSTGLSHRTGLTALSEGHSQIPADRPRPNPATTGQGIAEESSRSDG